MSEIKIKVRYYNYRKEHTTTLEPDVLGTDSINEVINHYKSLAFGDEPYLRVFLNDKCQSGWVRTR